MSTWLYRFEAKGIQSYVFGSSRLRHVVGASALIEGLTAIDETPSLLRHVLELLGHDLSPARSPVVASAAGGATLSFEHTDDLHAFAARWPMEVELFAPGLTLAQAWVPDGPDARRALHARLAGARSFAPMTLPIANPVLERSESGSLPASAFDVTAPDRGPIDRRVERMEWAATPGGALLDAVDARLAGGDASGLRFPRDLEQISGARFREYLAVIHADGNAVGQRVMSLPTDGYKRFAAALREATLAAARTATDVALRSPDGGIALGRPVVIGGDDITVIVRADRALPFVQAYCRAFEANTAASDAIGQGLTATAGVAFVRRRHPFHLAYALAESLCDDAKYEGKRVDADLPPSLVAFRRLSASLSDTPQLSGDRSLTMGPYRVTHERESDGLWPLDEVRRLGGALALRDVARGPVRELARVLQEEPERAETKFARVRRVQRRAQGEASRAWRRHVESALDALSPQLMSVPWASAVRRTDAGTIDVRVTPWLDALTIAKVEGADALTFADTGKQDREGSA